MLLSYGVIWWYILSNDRKLKRVDSRKEIQKVITKRELQTAMTFFSVFLCYFVCVMPFTIINLINQRILNDYPALNFALGCLFYLQFSINIFIYAAKSEQYKKAYIYFLKKVSRKWNLFNIFFIKIHNQPTYRLGICVIWIMHCTMSLRQKIATSSYLALQSKSQWIQRCQRK